jgi:hypothetical protein
VFKSLRFGKSKCPVLKCPSQSWKKTVSSLEPEDRSKSLAEVEQCVASTVDQDDDSFKTFKKIKVIWRTWSIWWFSKSKFSFRILKLSGKKFLPPKLIDLAMIR